MHISGLLGGIQHVCGTCEGVVVPAAPVRSLGGIHDAFRCDLADAVVQSLDITRPDVGQEAIVLGEQEVVVRPDDGP